MILCMSLTKKKRNAAGITDKRGMRYTGYVATATQNLKDFLVYVHGHIL